MVMGRKPDDFVRSWVPPFTKRELYQDNQYTLSGSIYESARNGVCTNLAEMMGVSPWPCQERGANDGSEKYRPKWMNSGENTDVRSFGSEITVSMESAHPLARSCQRQIRIEQTRCDTRKGILLRCDYIGGTVRCEIPRDAVYMCRSVLHVQDVPGMYVD